MIHFQLLYCSRLIRLIFLDQRSCSQLRQGFRQYGTKKLTHWLAKVSEEFIVLIITVIFRFRNPPTRPDSKLRYAQHRVLWILPAKQCWTVYSSLRGRGVVCEFTVTLHPVFRWMSYYYWAIGVKKNVYL